MNLYSIASSKIPDVRLYSLDMHKDERGWFKESYNNKDLVSIGFPADFKPVQNNISFNNYRGVTRGMHAEPWDKYISLASGVAFIALVDLRAGFNFGSVQTYTIESGDAVYVPRGVANSYQVLEGKTSYTYLVNDYWSESSVYTMVNLADPSLNIDWPISLTRSVISKKDLAHPFLTDISPIKGT